MRSLAPLILLGLAQLLPSQDAAPTRGVMASPPFHGVFVSEPYDDGCIWVRGDRYKLGLLPGRAVFQPLFGPRASADYPLALQLVAAEVGGADLALDRDAGWRRAGNRLERDLGGIVERWDCAPDRVQQSFVVRRAAVAGAVELRLATATDLQPVDTGSGVDFIAPDGLGHVHYSDAVVFDAVGRRLAVPVGLRGGQIVIAVPATFVAEAAWPLLIDPYVNTVFVDQSASDLRDPVVAYDPTDAVWLVVAEEHLSATDVDIVCRRYDRSRFPPVLLDTVYAHNSPELTHNPDVGNLPAVRRFIVAWHNTTNQNGRFEWRARSASSVLQDPLRSASAGIGPDLDNRPRVGAATTGDRWLLVMFRNQSGLGTITVELTQANGMVFAFGVLGPVNGFLGAGDVSTLADVNDRWAVVWSECGPRCITASVRMQALGSTGGFAPLVVEPPLTLASGSDSQPRIAGSGGNLLAVWAHASVADRDIHGVRLGPMGGVVAPLGPVLSLTQLEPNAMPPRSQHTPAVSADGCRFVYAYLEDDNGGSVLPRSATVVPLGGGLLWHEGHVLLPTFSNAMLGGLDLAAGAGIDFGTHWAVWDQPGLGGQGDVLGAILDARDPGITSVVHDTGCGTPAEPAIALSGTPALGRSFTVALQNVVGFPFLLVGAESVQLLPGCGTCRSGVQLNSSITLVGSSLSIAVPCEPGFLGFRLAFQGIVLGQPGGCPLPVFGAEFTVSDTLTVAVR